MKPPVPPDAKALLRIHSAATLAARLAAKQLESMGYSIYCRNHRTTLVLSQSIKGSLIRQNLPI